MPPVSSSSSHFASSLTSPTLECSAIIMRESSMRQRAKRQAELPVLPCAPSHAPYRLRVPRRPARIDHAGKRRFDAVRVVEARDAIQEGVNERQDMAEEARQYEVVVTLFYSALRRRQFARCQPPGSRMLLHVGFLLAIPFSSGPLGLSPRT